MERRSPGILLHLKPYGDKGVIASVFTLEFGRISGLVRGSNKKTAPLQPGAIVSCAHFRRLNNQLGSLQLEIRNDTASQFFSDFTRLKVLQHVTETMHLLLPEETEQPKFFDRTRHFLTHLGGADLWEHLANWEMDLLHAIGYGLTLEPELAVRGEGDNTPLCYVSPKSGRAVSEAMGKPYHDKMLLLPTFFGGIRGGFLDVFQLTGHFLGHAVHELAPRRKLESRVDLLDLAIETEFRA